MKKEYLVLTGAAAVFFLLGGSAGYMVGEVGKVQCEAEEREMQKEIETLRARAEVVLERQQIFDLTGTIMEIDQDGIVIETGSLASAPGEPGTETKRVLIGPDTKIVKIEYGTTPDGGPGKETEITVNGLAVNDLVTARSTEGMSDERNFTASRIEVMATPPDLNPDD